MTADVYKRALTLHSKKHGKLEVTSKIPLKIFKTLSLAYTPGVAEVSRVVAQNNELAYKYTIKANTVAVVSNGSAVLGLGDIGPYGAIPVMEGKAAIFKEFADIDAFPICLATDDIVHVVKSIAPVFGGINLEDIKAPECFDIEAQLQDIGIPVMHDDQHGTAIVASAGLLNAAEVLRKDLRQMKVVISGAGAAGTAIAKFLLSLNKNQRSFAPKDIIVCDSKGAIYNGRADLNQFKKDLARFTNKEECKGTLADAMQKADVFIGVSAPGIVTEKMVKSMNDNPIIFALANPVPEIMPEIAHKAGAAIVATGRSDYPNQVNNALSFPGVFRGALDARAKRITEKMKVAAAFALKDLVKRPKKDQIIPEVFDKRIVKEIAKAVKGAS